MEHKTPSNFELAQRAIGRRRQSEHGIGAAFYDDITENDRDGRLFQLAATDTINGYRWVEVLSPRLERRTPVETEAVERAVERRAGVFPMETRLQDLQDNSPLVIDPAELLEDAA